MFKNKNSFLLLIVFSASSFYASNITSDTNKKSNTLFAYLKNAGSLAVGTASAVMLAASAFGLKNDCKKLFDAYFAPMQENYIQVPLDADATMFEGVNIQEQAKNVGLRSALIVMSGALCYYCYFNIFK